MLVGFEKEVLTYVVIVDEVEDVYENVEDASFKENVTFHSNISND